MSPAILLDTLFSRTSVYKCDVILENLLHLAITLAFLMHADGKALVLYEESLLNPKKGENNESVYFVFLCLTLDYWIEIRYSDYSPII